MWIVQEQPEGGMVVQVTGILLSRHPTARPAPFFGVACCPLSLPTPFLSIPGASWWAVSCLWLNRPEFYQEMSGPWRRAAVKKWSCATSPFFCHWAKRGGVCCLPCCRPSAGRGASRFAGSRGGRAQGQGGCLGLLHIHISGRPWY